MSDPPTDSTTLPPPQTSAPSGRAPAEDNVYGEATIVEARIKEATAVQARNVFFNRTHAQSFADQELARALQRRPAPIVTTRSRVPRSSRMRDVPHASVDEVRTW